MIHKTYALTLEEKQELYRLLRKKGMSHEDSRQEVYELNELQKKLAGELRKKNQPETHIKSKLQEKFAASLEKLGQELEQ